MKRAAILVLLPLLAAIALQAQAPRPVAPPAAIKPKLVVLISVDQMRGDYVDRFRHQCSKGLHRLVAEGAWFRQADYPYYTTVTCAGHASISTGTVPAVHGMVANSWAVQNNSRIVSCTDDESQKLISYGSPVSGVGHSAANLMSPTLADEMRSQTWPAARVVGISLKARSAINLSGHKPDAVIWLDEGDGGWVTSTAFAHATSPFFADYIAKHPMSEQLGRTWERALPKERYLFEYSKEFRRRTPHITTEFPQGARQQVQLADPPEARLVDLPAKGGIAGQKAGAVCPFHLSKEVGACFEAGMQMGAGDQVMLPGFWNGDVADQGITQFFELQTGQAVAAAKVAAQFQALELAQGEFAPRENDQAVVEARNQRLIPTHPYPAGVHLMDRVVFKPQFGKGLDIEISPDG